MLTTSVAVITIVAMDTTTAAALAIGRQVLALRHRRLSLAPTVPAPAGEPLELISLHPAPLRWLGDDVTPTVRPSGEGVR